MNPDLTDAGLAERKRVAEAAAQRMGSPKGVNTWFPAESLIAAKFLHEYAIHIALNDPEAVIALCDEITALREGLEAVDASIHYPDEEAARAGMFGLPLAERDALRVLWEASQRNEWTTEGDSQMCQAIGPILDALDASEERAKKLRRTLIIYRGGVEQCRACGYYWAPSTPERHAAGCVAAVEAA